jgi:hypothetical protein
MDSMFWNTPFNGDISGWNISSVTELDNIFNCPILDEHKPSCLSSLQEFRVKEKYVNMSGEQARGQEKTK